MRDKANPAAGNGGAQSNSAGGFKLGSTIAEPADTRCRRCGRVLHSEKAIEAEAGWRCARLAAEAGDA